MQTRTTLFRAGLEGPLQAELATLLAPFALVESEEPQGWFLTLQDGALVLRNAELPKQGDILVDFASGASTYRRKFGGGKGEGIAKAVGLGKKPQLRVIDATAGLGRDAFVLASLGAHVTLVERNPAVAALLADGLRRAALDAQTADWLPARMQLVHLSALQALSTLPPADVVFLDPMFPPREKSALVKKEMRAFHDVVGADEDADGLLAPALALATHRVVVKRPGYAGFLAAQKPTMSIEGKNNRFDVYVNAGF
ncbi:class I SAM-dependent methyltransferase [Rheinheimera texasensis]|uniref:class I SAM-dependent methyltransferase n=1 Tax=Rheinheimera texasensis TaxID=306205 RepID=UPI0032B2A444